MENTTVIASSIFRNVWLALAVTSAVSAAEGNTLYVSRTGSGNAPIESFNGLTGVSQGLVTTSGINGSGDTELQFGPDGNLYGLGTNGYVYKYDFALDRTTLFATPEVRSSFGGVSGFTFSQSGTLYVSRTGNGEAPIESFNGLTGVSQGLVTTNGFNGSGDAQLQFGPDGNLYGLGTNGYVYKYDFALDRTTLFATPEVRSSFGGISGFTFSQSGTLYVSRTGNGEAPIESFNGLTGVSHGLVTTNGFNGSGDAQLQFGPDGNLYGLGTNGYVYKYDFVLDQTTLFASPEVRSSFGGVSGFTFLSPVPEPDTSVLMIFGTGLIGFTVRRKAIRLR